MKIVDRVGEIVLRIKEARAIYARRIGPNPDVLGRAPELITTEDVPHLVWRNEIGYVIARFRVRQNKVTLLK